MRHLFENWCILSDMSTCATRTCPTDLILPCFIFIIVFPQLHIPGQIINKLVEGKDAKADFIIGCFSTTLKQAGEGYSRWCSR